MTTMLGLWMGAVIFACGVFGLLTRRNLILMFLSLELMLFGASLNFILFGSLHGDLGGQVFVVLILTVAASEAALGLALVVILYRSRGSLDVQLWSALRDRPTSAPLPINKSTIRQDNVIMTDDSYGELPTLTPAGRDPLVFPVHSDPKQQEPVGTA